MATTGDLVPDDLLAQEARLALPSFSEQDALDLGALVAGRGLAAGLAITVEVRRAGRVVYRAALPGSDAAQDGWIVRKARVVEHGGHATMYERVRYESADTTFEQATGLPESEYAAHGGGFPLSMAEGGLAGILLISGLPQVQDHELAVACLEEFLAGRTSATVRPPGASSLATLEWDEVSARLGAEKVWWMATASPAAGPHSVPVWGVIVDGVAYTTAEPTSRRVRDLHDDPRTVVHLESGSDVLIVRGRWSDEVQAHVRTAVLAAYAAKYDSPAEAAYLPDAPGMGPLDMFVLEPARALSWRIEDFEGSHRRWSAPR